MVSSASETSLRQRLRHETRALHEQIERTIDLLRPQADTRDYIGYLERMFGFLEPIERVLGAVPGIAADGALDFARRRKAHLVADDLKALGYSDAALAALPRARFEDFPRSRAEALGCLYVLEGSTLGGQVLVRQLSTRHPETMKQASLFLRGYGEQTGARWKAFESVLTEHQQRAPEETDDVVQAASKTFAAMIQWFEESKV